MSLLAEEWSLLVQLLMSHNMIHSNLYLHSVTILKHIFLLSKCVLNWCPTTFHTVTENKENSCITRRPVDLGVAG